MTSEGKKIAAFLQTFHNSGQAGLLVAEDRFQLAKVHALLARESFLFAKSWTSTLRQLALDVPVAALLHAPFASEFYDTIRQYQSKRGMIQITDSRSHDVMTVHCNPRSARLLLVTDVDELTAIEQLYQLRDTVGLIAMV
jgi:hypothetical protein